MQIYRLLEIVYILLSQKIVTAKELSEKFGVSQRTIYRDIEVLNMAGIPVYSEKGKGGGTRLLPEFVLNKSILSEQEQNEILSALKAFSGIKSNETNQVLKKLAAFFNKDTADWLQIDFSSWGVAGNDFFDIFKAAILEKRIVEFDYYSSAYYEKSFRSVEPVQLWFKSKAWYMRGYCLKLGELRLFKLTRIRNLIITDTYFHDRSLPAVPTPSESKEQLKNNVSLKLKIEPEMIYRVFDEFDENMVEKQEDGSLIVSVTWPEDNWVYGFILSFGEFIEVLEPRHVRENIKKKLIKMQKKYL